MTPQSQPGFRQHPLVRVGPGAARVAYSKLAIQGSARRVVTEVLTSCLRQRWSAPGVPPALPWPPAAPLALLSSDAPERRMCGLVIYFRLVWGCVAAGPFWGSRYRGVRAWARRSMPPPGGAPFLRLALPSLAIPCRAPVPSRDCRGLLRTGRHSGWLASPWRVKGRPLVSCN